MCLSQTDTTNLLDVIDFGIQSNRNKDGKDDSKDGGKDGGSDGGGLMPMDEITLSSGDTTPFNF